MSVAIKKGELAMLREQDGAALGAACVGVIAAADAMQSLADNFLAGSRSTFRGATAPFRKQGTSTTSCLAPYFVTLSRKAGNGFMV